MFFILMLIMTISPITICNFNVDSNSKNWVVIDDGVMGGKSKGNFKIDKNGNASFYGKVSLENNGGFSMARFRFKKQSLDGHKYLKLRLKGDGKRYQFRIKQSSGTYYSYVKYFNTRNDWQDIQINLSEMYPSYRGRRLDGDNFNHENLEEIAFLISNKKDENFNLLIKSVVIE
jgi:NADH dehydrogenase [ubiquinone] 1 alpha subcomplex assembly factor 1